MRKRRYFSPKYAEIEGNRDCRRYDAVARQIRSMVSIATNDELTELVGESSEEGKQLQPPEKPTVGDNVNNIETSQKTGNFDDQTGKRADLEHAKTGESRDVPGESRGAYEGATVDKERVERPKRHAKPSVKSIKNRIQSGKAKLEKSWGKVQKSISQLQASPNSLDEIRSAMSEVRSAFNNYQVLWLSYVDFLANTGTLECLEARKTEEVCMRNHQQFVDTNIAQANERKEEISLEIRSARSSSHASSTSSSALRARIRADAAAAKKKLELQKRRSLLESESVLRIQQQEFALAKQKIDEQARLETLRLEGAAAIAEAKVSAIDDELGLGDPHELLNLNLPEEIPSQRVQRYVENHCPQSTDDAPAAPLNSSQPQPSTEHVNPAPLDPAATNFTPKSHMDPNPSSDQSTMKSCLEFMACRELIANKIERFDNNPANFHSWSYRLRI